MSERRGMRKFLAARRLSWRTFWARRAPWRITFVKILLIVSLPVVVYLALPREAQTWIQQAWLDFIHALTALLAFASATPLAGAVALLILICLALIFVRPYHRPTYLATTRSAIPLISVYVDAENQLPNAAIPRFTEFLMQYLNGRRADRLYFMDASSGEHGAQTEQFKRLYRYGFRPVHVARNPTGEAKNDIKEAVDKELAMHAYERALLGPEKQEFIIVTADQDFVALVYRLAALGHHVQIWATPMYPAYRELATYLDIELLDLALLASESISSNQEDANDQREIVSEQADGIQASGRESQSNKNQIPPYEVAEPTLLSEAGEKQLYRAIVQTIRVRDDCEQKHLDLQSFRKAMGSELTSRLAGVGYRGASKSDYWLDHLYVTGALRKPRNAQLPGIGEIPPETAAHALFIAAQCAAEAAVAMGQLRPDGIVSETDIANAMLAQRVRAQGRVRSLLNLIDQTNKRRTTHARYLVRCAQALGLIEFDLVPNMAHLIRMPRLVETSDAESPDAAEDLDAALAKDDPDAVNGEKSALLADFPAVTTTDSATSEADGKLNFATNDPVENLEIVDGVVGADVGDERPSSS